MEDQKQTTKEIISKWRDAVDVHNRGSYDEAIDTYMEIKEISARMLYNMACAYTKLQQYDRAIQCLSTAVEKDVHFAIAFFQRGILYLEDESIVEALQDLETTRTLLRGNSFIDYKPLGMVCKVHLWEVLYNMALAYLRYNHVKEAVCLLREALHDADDKQRIILMTALKNIQNKKADEITPAYISIDVLFTPPKGVISNLEKKDVVGKARVVSSSNIHDHDPSFNGMKRVEELKSSPHNSPKPDSRKCPMCKVRQFFDKKQKGGSRSNSLDVPMKKNAMRESKSTGDIGQTVASSDNNSLKISNSSLRASFTLLRRPVSDEIKSTNAVATTERTSLGSVFGNTLTVLSQALSTSCDVLTAFTAPPSDESEDGGYHPIEKDFERKGSMVKRKNRNKTEKQIDTTETLNKDTTDTADGKVNTSSQDTQMDTDTELNDEKLIMSDGVELRRRNFRRSRPPPPSYPPPPLPPKIIITL